MNNYSIVEFIEESTVEIIPSSWILSDKKTTLWPKGIIPSILKKYLKNCTESGTNWSTVKIRVLGHTSRYLFSFYLFLLSIIDLFLTSCIYKIIKKRYIIKKYFKEKFVTQSIT